MNPSQFPLVPLAELIERVANPVDVKKDEMYEQIGIRSHGKGIFYKEPVTGKSLGNKRVFWVESDCFTVNIVFAWEQAVACTTKADISKIASHRFPMYRPKQGKIDIDFLLYLFNTKFGKHLLTLASPGGAGRNKTLGQSEFMRLQIPLPHIEEQRHIVQILSTCDKAIETTEKLIANSETQKKALMQQLLTGKKRLPGFEGEWKITTLGNIVDIDPEILPSSTNPNYTFSYISLSEIEPGRIVSEIPKITFASSPSRARKIVKKGDLLMSTVRPNLRGFAKIAIDNSDLVASTGFAVLRAKETTNTDFVFHYLFSEFATKQIDAFVAGSNYPAINTSDVQKLSIKLPEYKEQKNIAELLNVAESAIQVLGQNKRKLQTEKMALMQQLLTGKRRVKVEEITT